MAEEHPSFRQPSNLAIPVWRYTDLAKFAWSLQNSALYFTRADLLGDPFEGYITKKMAVEGPLDLIEYLKAEAKKSDKDFGDKEMTS